MGIITLCLLLALTNRIRGGLFGERIRKYIPWYGTTIGRLIYSVAFGISLAMVSGHILLGTLAVGTVFLGHAIAPFAPWQAMERSNDILILGLRGAILNGATAVLIGAMGFYIPGLLFALSGLLMGLIYHLATRLPIVPVFNDNLMTRDRNDTAEVMFGALQGLIIAALF